MDILIKIKSFFDKSGADEAAKSADNLKLKQSDSVKSLSAGGQIAGKAAEQIGSVAAAMGGVGGAAGQAAAGVRLLSGAIQTIVASGGGFAGLLAAIALLVTSTLVNWLVKVAGETKALNEQAKEAERSLTGMSKVTFDRITEQAEKLRATAQGTADQYERVISARNKLLSAEEKAELAKLEYEKAVDLSKVKPNDDLARRMIESEYAKKAVAVSSAAESTRAAYGVASAETRVQTIIRQMEATQAELDRKRNTLGRENVRLAELEDRPWSMNKKDRAEQSSVIDEQRSKIEEHGKEIAQTEAGLQALRDQLRVAKMDLESAKITFETQPILSATKRQGLSNDQADIKADAEKTLAENLKSIEEIKKEKADLRARRLLEWADVVMARRQTSSSPDKADQQNSTWLKSMAGVGRAAGFDAGEMSDALRDGARKGRGGGRVEKELIEYRDVSKETGEKERKLEEKLKILSESNDRLTQTLSDVVGKIAARQIQTAEALKNLPHQSN